MVAGPTGSPIKTRPSQSLATFCSSLIQLLERSILDVKYINHTKIYRHINIMTTTHRTSKTEKMMNTTIYDAGAKSSKQDTDNQSFPYPQHITRSISTYHHLQSHISGSTRNNKIVDLWWQSYPNSTPSCHHTALINNTSHRHSDAQTSINNGHTWQFP